MSENSTTAEQKIVEALATYTWRSGYQLSELTGLGPGTLYPALMALEKRGQIISRWEDMPPPRRRRYSLELADQPADSQTTTADKGALIYALGRQKTTKCDLCGAPWTSRRQEHEVAVGPFTSWCCWPCSVKVAMKRHTS